MRRCRFPGGCRYTTDEAMYGDQNPDFCFVHVPMTAKQQWDKSTRDRFFAAINWATDQADESGGPLNLTGLELPDNLPLKLRPTFGLIMDGAISTIGYPDLFAGTIFDGDVRIRDLQFSGDANFVGAHFCGQRTQIALATPNGSADLSDCIFKNDVHLESIRSSDSIKLDRAQFHGMATLASLQSERSVSLEHARFYKQMSAFIATGQRINLDNIECRDVAAFELQSRPVSATTIRNATFLKGVDFRRSTLEGNFLFDDTAVAESARFDYVHFGGRASFEQCQFGGQAWFIGLDETSGARGNCFHDVSFARSVFRDRAVFINRHLKSPASFRDCYFSKAPEFHGADIHQSVQFPGENHFTDTISEGAAPAYRTLKLAMEKNRARQEEAMFFALELKSLRQTPGKMRWWDRWASYVYEKVARYGQSFSRPLAWLAVSWFIFALIYAVWMSAPIYWGEPLDGDVIGHGMTLSLEQVFSPFGIWKKSLDELCKVTKHVNILQLVATVQSLVSVGFVALFVLGLRWRFKRD
jgi:hypothetical protein